MYIKKKHSCIFFPLTADGASQCYDCGYLIDGWKEGGANVQTPMTDGTPQVEEICKNFKGILFAVRR